MMRAGTTAAQGPVRVLVVDDSLSGRLLIRHALGRGHGIEVVAELGSADEARTFLAGQSVDVITLDVEMPGTNGLDFLREVRRAGSAEVIMVSAHTRAGSRTALEALSAGAVDAFDRRGLTDAAVHDALRDVVIAAGASRPRASGVSSMPPAPTPAPAGCARARSTIVLIGASTGGVTALEAVLGAFPAECPPTIIAQHMPANFLSSFAERLNGLVAPRVVLVDRARPLEFGHVYLGAGGQDDIVLQRRGAGIDAMPTPRRPEARWTPSVDALFASALPWAPRVVAAILTGMGNDGTGGATELHDAGARTLAQSGDSCVVDGMPRSARDAGVIDRVVAIDAMGSAILDAVADGAKRRMRT